MSILIIILAVANVGAILFAGAAGRARHLREKQLWRDYYCDELPGMREVAR